MADAWDSEANDHVQIPVKVARAVQVLLDKSLANVEMLGAHAVTMAWAANMPAEYVAEFKRTQVDPVTESLDACRRVIDKSLSPR